jgi:molybdenum cofactor synthesis domain-containing protein
MSRAAVITISSSKARGEGRDESGPRLEQFAERIGIAVEGRDLIADRRSLIEGRLLHWSDLERCDLVLTTGGTGFSPDDVTPEATRAVIDREAPGIAEAIRAVSRDHTPHWMLSRGVAGIRGSTLIVNFPGSPNAIDQAGEAIAAAIPHALELLAGRTPRH